MISDPKRCLPHREPFLFVDAFEASTDGKTIKGSRLFREDDFFFKGHFPGNPIVPGVILVETMAQCGGCGITSAGIMPEGTLYVLASIGNVKFHHVVKPGDKFEIEVETLRVRSSFITQRAKGYVGGVLAAEAEWLCSCKRPSDNLM